MKRLDFSGSFSPGARSTPDDHVDARRTRDAKRFRHVASVEATRKHEGHAGIQILEKGPIESPAQSAGTRCVLGARASKINRSTTCAYWRVWDRSLPLRDRQRLHDRQSEARAHRDDTVRRFAAVELQHVRLERRHDVEQRVIISIDGERDLPARP